MTLASDACLYTHLLDVLSVIPTGMLLHTWIRPCCAAMCRDRRLQGHAQDVLRNAGLQHACNMCAMCMHHAHSIDAPCMQHGCLHHIRNMRCYACSIHGTCTQHALTCLQHTCIMCLTCSKPRHRGLSGRRSAAELCMVSFQAVEYQSVRTPHLKPDKSMQWSHKCSTYIALSFGSLSLNVKPFRKLLPCMCTLWCSTAAKLMRAYTTQRHSWKKWSCHSFLHTIPFSTTKRYLYRMGVDSELLQVVPRPTVRLALAHLSKETVFGHINWYNVAGYTTKMFLQIFQHDSNRVLKELCWLHRIVEPP